MVKHLFANTSADIKTAERHSVSLFQYIRASTTIT